MCRDVIEREKYDLLQSGYETLKHQLEDAWNRIDELDKLNGHMQEKIDKAIEEIESTLYVDSLIFGELYDFKNGKIDDDVIEEFNRVPRKEVLDILKRNIGE